ncbi:acyl carrier protein [Cytobacillus purgationiresistens]|uniref:Acyl carrier protein n=1 Tax=Cytobacillus purgationiresistens TaxID=863449 RepID=A0ABU0ASE0_9BACI|nr:acyl carrier protein [Cytobacillus purgationiresistens]MDQ0273784.1 acyl carrier protein [Cytobacillus purgationiresistens]
MEKNLKMELREIVADLIEIDDFQDDEDFIVDLGLDSMMSIEIVAQIEQKYKIDISEEYLGEFQTLNDVERIVKTLIKDQLETNPTASGVE